jgi:hypothetical protein
MVISVKTLVIELTLRASNDAKRDFLCVSSSRTRIRFAILQCRTWHTKRRHIKKADVKQMLHRHYAQWHIAPSSMLIM